jgi:phosphoribosylamine--glycine ligase
MGDPECQTILPKLNTDLIEIFLACCDKKLQDIKLSWSNKKSLCVVICSKGYPDNYKKYVEIKDLENINIDENNHLFHAGTEKRDKKIYAVGGRVLNFVGLSENFADAKKNVMNNLKKLDWSEGFYRKDIGHKVLK